MSDKQRRVVCAAIRAADGEILVGIRHYSADMLRHIHGFSGGHRFTHRQGDDQGFVDQYGKYMTRREAYDVALAAGQIVYPSACIDGELYSEGLY